MKPTYVQHGLEPSNEGIFTNISNWFGDRSGQSKFATSDVTQVQVMDTYKWLKEAKARIQAMPGIYDKDAWNMTVGKDARMSLVAAPSGTSMIDHKMILRDQGVALQNYEIMQAMLESCSNRLIAISQTFGKSAPYQRIRKQVEEVSKSIDTGAFGRILNGKIYGRNRAFKSSEQMVGFMYLVLGDSNGLAVPKLIHMTDDKKMHALVNTGIRGADKGELVALIDQCIKSQRLLEDLQDLTVRGGALLTAMDKSAELFNNQRDNTDPASAHMIREAAGGHFDLCYEIMVCANTAYYEIGAMARALKVYVLGSERRIK